MTMTKDEFIAQTAEYPGDAIILIPDGDGAYDPVDYVDGEIAIYQPIPHYYTYASSDADRKNRIKSIVLYR
jgi:hypothetical protein